MIKKEGSEIQKKFGFHLKKIRNQKGLSLRAMARNCEIDDSNISKIENGKFDVQLTTIIELAKGLDIHPKDLLDF
ncbi:helix-turn-helix transcriptional regulator [Pedobacter sp. HDW13]|uniref:helix-turn-helix domain-containing protein n=1 Tax=unclassified Pedobacter TaxID=2628915 RepID=UPI000F5A7842|nr:MULTISPECIES: helix-turn-helix transcriptional regulator [unclassified Pedobacter]QIL42204.1 helix-turn-helix transcriptional regulator [Pedobacter sp. HDW13]RQO76557.1 XRE family transcriptional regulator [Pedobacter sp. KBW01]